MARKAGPLGRHGREVVAWPVSPTPTAAFRPNERVWLRSGPRIVVVREPTRQKEIEKKKEVLQSIAMPRKTPADTWQEATCSCLCLLAMPPARRAGWWVGTQMSRETRLRRPCGRVHARHGCDGEASSLLPSAWRTFFGHPKPKRGRPVGGGASDRAGRLLARSAGAAWARAWAWSRTRPTPAGSFISPPDIPTDPVPASPTTRGDRPDSGRTASGSGPGSQPNAARAAGR